MIAGIFTTILTPLNYPASNGGDIYIGADSLIAPSSGRGIVYCGNVTTYTPIHVTSGGTGLATILSHGLLIGAGTSAVVATSALTFDGTTFAVTGIANITSNLVVQGTSTLQNVTGIIGTFTGALSGTSGTFSAGVSGTTGTFTGAVSGTTGTFSGAVSGTTGTFASGVTANVTGNVTGSSGTVTSIATHNVGELANVTSGSFSPVITFGGGQIGITYSVQTGLVRRVGSIVTVSVAITLISKGSSTGAAALYLSVIGIGSLAQATSYASYHVSSGKLVLPAGASTANFVSSADATVALTDADFQNDSIIVMTFTYINT